MSGRKDDGLLRFAMMNGLTYSSAELLRTLQQYRVGRALLLSPPLKGRKILPNQEIIKLCRRSLGILKPVVTVEPSPREVKAAIQLAERERREVKAFKIRLGYVKSSAASSAFGPLYDYAESEKLPVLFHTGDTAFSNGDLALSHPLTLDGLANKRDELRIVLCHFGNPWFEDVAELIYKHPNVYTDTSGLITPGAYADKYAEWLAGKISAAVYYAQGADKILFGTDYPVTKHSDALALIERLDVDRRDKEKILWRNAERLFGL